MSYFKARASVRHMDGPSRSRGIGRPPSFSEGAISLPRVESSQKPLMLHVGSLNSDVWSVGSSTTTGLELDPPPAATAEPGPEPLTLSQPAPAPPPRPFYIDTAHRWSIRFTLHLSLIAIFETVFFWNVVAQSEDDALTSLIGSYTGGIVSSLSNLTAADRNATAAALNALINIAAINAQGAAAAAGRNDYNAALLARSWTYFGATLGLCALLSVLARVRQLPIQWRHVALENVALVTLLGIYEWMFFHTVVFRYRAVSMEELDRNIVNQIAGALMS